MTTTEKIDKFIAENGGNERDALNVALARLEACQKEKQFWKKEAQEVISIIKETEIK